MAIGGEPGPHQMTSLVAGIMLGSDVLHQEVAQMRSPHALQRAQGQDFGHGRRVDGVMSDRSVARLVQHYAANVGLDPTLVGGHSLSADFLTETARHGASLAKMQEVSRHKKVEVLFGYVRSAELFEDHSGSCFL